MSRFAPLLQWTLRAILFAGGWILQKIQDGEDRLVRLFKKPQYVRKAGCQMTGMCCRNLGIQFPRWWLRHPWVVRYFIWWHRYRFNFHFLEKTDDMLIYECGYLTPDNKCSIYPWRPRLCREYPKQQLWGFPKLHKGCGFHFARRGGKDFFQMLSSKNLSL